MGRGEDERGRLPGRKRKGDRLRPQTFQRRVAAHPGNRRVRQESALVSAHGALKDLLAQSIIESRLGSRLAATRQIGEAAILLTGVYALAFIKMPVSVRAGAMATILLAEDDESLRRFLAAGLERARHAVTQFCDGGEGHEWLQGGSFDLLLSDIVMPGPDGIELSEN